jgi:hypothetical protein
MATPLAIFFVATFLSNIIARASLVLRDPRCPVDWEYWCEDRCGADIYGDTCCPISGERHNLCGLGMVTRDFTILPTEVSRG